MKALKFALLLALAVILGTASLTLSGCATSGGQPGATGTKETPLQIAGKSLLATKSAITAAAITTDGLCKAGTLKADICGQAKAAYGQAKTYYDSAIDSYLLVSQGGDPAQLEQTMLRLRNIVLTMQQLATPVAAPEGGVK